MNHAVLKAPRRLHLLRNWVMASFALSLVCPELGRGQSPGEALGPVGRHAVYRRAPGAAMRTQDVAEVSLALGSLTNHQGQPAQWLWLAATKLSGDHFKVGVLAGSHPTRPFGAAPSPLLRYLFQSNDELPREYVDARSGMPVLPTLGRWEILWPSPVTGSFTQGVAAAAVHYLGHVFTLVTNETLPDFADGPPLAAARRLPLRPDLILGLPSNSRTTDDRRRFDGSDYPMVRLTRADYAEMIRAGMNCLHVDTEQAAWLRDEPVFLWGMPVADLKFPECLYESTCLGPALFLDEPAVGTRDYDVRPRLAQAPALRHAWSPEAMLLAFSNHFAQAVAVGAPAALFKGLQARPDVDLGDLHPVQQNLFSWESMVATAAWQLNYPAPGRPVALVFEPPGQLGTLRTIPEMNMAYGCQLPADRPTSLANLLAGFLRGAARSAHADWGISIYGAVDPADAPFLLSHAYDLGAKYFFFWDNYQSACVPFGECLALTRQLVAHANRHPDRDLAQLRAAARTLILLPPGYDLGHVHMGRGDLWGLTELNLERRNSAGVTHRQVMGAFFVEVERCERFGIPYDLRWDLPGLETTGYAEVVRVRRDARVEVSLRGKSQLLRAPRAPARPHRVGPRLALTVIPDSDRRGGFLARAVISEGDAPVYYCAGPDRQGVYPNSRVLFELFGPEEEDYLWLSGSGGRSKIERQDNQWVVERHFQLNHPGRYRLRAATSDLGGQSDVQWSEFKATP